MKYCKVLISCGIKAKGLTSVIRTFEVRKPGYFHLDPVHLAEMGTQICSISNNGCFE